MGLVAFQKLSSNLRIPGTFLELNPGSNGAVPNLATLLIGQMLSTGSAVANNPGAVTSAADVRRQAGAGSMLDAMATQYFGTDNTGTVYILPLADAPSSTHATSTVTLTGTATSTGTVALYVGGQRFAVGVSSGDTAATVAVNLMALFALAVSTPFSAANASGVLTLTVRNAGLVGNGMDVRINAGGSQAGETLPSGLTVVTTAMAGGTVNPDLAAALANLSDAPFEFIVGPYTDATDLNEIAAFLGDTSGRWSPTNMLYGVYLSAATDTAANLIALGDSRNDPHVSILGLPSMPTWTAVAAAEYAAQVAISVRADPGLPLQNIALNLPSSPIAARHNFATRNTLLFNGISTVKFDPAGNPILELAITTNQYNTAGLPDVSYLEARTDFLLGFVCRDLRIDVGTTFARKKLAPDGSRLVDTNTVTPNVIKTHIVSRYRYLESIGVVVDSKSFAKNIIVENAGNGRVNVFAPITLIGSVRQVAILVDFTTF